MRTGYISQFCLTGDTNRAYALYIVGYHDTTLHPALLAGPRELLALAGCRFLEDATKRILLQRVGRGYHFTHQLLLDYFADLDTTVPSTSSGNQLPPQPSSPETA